MKKLIMTVLTACFAFGSQAQTDSVFKNIVEVNFETDIKFDQVDLRSPPTNPDFAITNDEFVSKLTNAFNYWNMDHAKSLYNTTLYLIPKGNSVDSSLVIEGENNSFWYSKANNKWHLNNFTIKGTNISLRNISCGLTSKEVFKMLGKKTKTPVGDGQIWISDKDNKYHFVFTFAKDKLVSMQL